MEHHWDNGFGGIAAGHYTTTLYIDGKFSYADANLIK